MLKMAKATVKKIDVKKIAKDALSAEIATFLMEKGFAVNVDTADYGFSGGTLIVGTADTDVQIKFVTPKAGITKYEVKEDLEA